MSDAPPPSTTRSGATEPLHSILVTDPLLQKLVQDTDISTNFGIRIINTTEDRVRLAAMTYLQQIDKRRGWIAPAGLLIPILATLVSADFHDAFLPAATWHALFILAGLASLVWLVLSIIDAVKAPTIDDFIKALRASEKR